MTGRRTGDAPTRLTVIDSDTPPDVDPVIRLNQFRAEQPEVNIIQGPFRCVAEIPAGTLPGDGREVVTGSADLCGLMDNLDRLFRPAGADLLKTCGTLPRPEGGGGVPRDGCARRLRGPGRFPGRPCRRERYKAAVPLDARPPGAAPSRAQRANRHGKCLM
jgi:hypothetical protein